MSVEQGVLISDQCSELAARHAAAAAAAVSDDEDGKCELRLAAPRRPATPHRAATALVLLSSVLIYLRRLAAFQSSSGRRVEHSDWPSVRACVCTSGIYRSSLFCTRCRRNEIVSSIILACLDSVMVEYRVSQK